MDQNTLFLAETTSLLAALYALQAGSSKFARLLHQDRRGREVFRRHDWHLSPILIHAYVSVLQLPQDSLRRIGNCTGYNRSLTGCALPLFMVRKRYHKQREYYSHPFDMRFCKYLSSFPSIRQRISVIWAIFIKFAQYGHACQAMILETCCGLAS